MDSDTPMFESDAEVVSDTQHFVVAVDFGTTFSSVAYVGYTHPTQRLRIGFQQIEIVDRYPDNPYGNFTCHDVPTEIWYSQKPGTLLPNSGSYPAHQSLTDDTSSEDEDDDDDDEPERDAASEEDLELDLPSVDVANGDRNPASLFWGYGVQDQLKETGDDADHSRRLTRFKLMLDDSEHTATVRSTLGETCKSLKKMQLIEEDSDVIADYLEQLFRHTKKRLIESEGYTDASTVEFALCIPAIWKAGAVRQMQVAMNNAIAKCGLEPEAAAACLLASEKTRLTIGDTFILLDAGGGTVDAITYSVDKHIPLRLKTEEVDPGGAMCGSSFINEKFQELLITKLKFEDYLWQNGETPSKIVNGLVVDFERQGKKKMDLMLRDRGRSFTVIIPGLRENKNKKKGFQNGKLILTRKEAKRLFKECVEGVAQVMLRQLRMTQQKGREVKKVILMGGFGQSEYLSAYLRDTLKEECGLGGKDIMLDSSKLPSTAVARGAVIRALRKEDGPARILQASYGFLRTEAYGTHEFHASQTPKTDKIDGIDYIDNTIQWIINKGDHLDSEKVFSRDVEYTFGLRKAKLLCIETLYASDQRHESHYRVGHPENNGAEREGFIIFDMTFLKTTGQIKAQPPKKPRGVPYYKVSATLVITVSGRNLRYEVRWPGGNGAVQAVGQSSLAAAFRPGTE